MAYVPFKTKSITRVLAIGAALEAVRLPYRLYYVEDGKKMPLASVQAALVYGVPLPDEHYVLSIMTSDSHETDLALALVRRMEDLP